MTTLAAQDPVSTFLGLIKSRSPRQAADLALAQLNTGRRPDEVIRGLLARAQQEVGELWHRAAWTVEEEHKATAVTDTALHQVAVAADPRADGRGTLAVVCAEGDLHTLPAKMAAELLRLDGWEVTFLGMSTSMPDLVHRLVSARPDGLVVTCSVPTGARGVLAIANAVSTLGIPTVAGGRGMGPDGRRARALGVRWSADLGGLAAALVGAPPQVDAADLQVRSAADRALALRRSTIVPAAMAELHRTWAPMESLNTWQLARTEEDLAYILDFASAARLTDDPLLFDEFLYWLTALLAVRHVPSAAVRLGLRALSAATADSPGLSRLLGSAADRDHGSPPRP